MRRGFSLITGIFMIVAIGALGIAVLNLAATSEIQKSEAFLRVQAELLARSATEHAVYLLQLNPTSVPDIYEIRADPFTITVTRKVIANTDPDFAELAGTALIDVVVEVRDITMTDLEMPIRYARRTVQRP
ncbi:hypothetical protein AGMMS50229_14940 [Campylobacterota bacterium]|nr:hypothetical protein AGMMS50229_14940 [Campylobacterota bacterium]